ncbi:hypothetical protein D3C75_1175270 [compost metagenome]
MRGDDAPAAGQFDPGLHLPADTVAAGATEFGAGDGHIISVGGDDGVFQYAIQPF